MTNRHRLDRAIEPTLYRISLTPDLKAFTFTGRESISLRAHGAFSKITLHALELKITDAVIHLGRVASIKARRIAYDERYETVVLDFETTLPASTALTLELGFSGMINDKLHGFYRTSYEANGKKQWGGATQFEATDARRAFPCWDEPDKKAQFELTLRVPKELTALSNMPAVSQRPVARTNLKEITYAPTVKMSTYLLAWVIARLESVERRDKNGIPVRIWTTPGKRKQARFALEAGCHALAYFAKWFDIPYALPKLDMVALPDFASGAMENWGLVTYRETTLLVDPKQSSIQARQRVAEVIAHELAHQWFGNLVTMEWWTDLWLNEGFASYMGPKAVDDQFPQWKIWHQYVSGEYLAALHEDSLRHSHPIEIPVRNPAEIREIFDNITYSKGSSVNRMLEHTLTEPVFRKGLSVYLKRYAYKNARTTDLWEVLEEVSGKPVKAIMTSFTQQEGYPVVRVETRGAKLAVSQQRFLADGRKDKTGKRWSIPLVGKVWQKQKPFYGLLDKRKAELKIPGLAAGRWVKLNAGQSGFYRTNYSPPLFGPLKEAASAKQLPALDCLGLIDDAFSLAKAGHIPTSQALELLESCRRYTDYNVWLTISGALASVEHILPDETVQARLEKFAHGVFMPAMKHTGWLARRADSHLDALLRALVISRLGHFRHPPTVEEAQKRFKQHVQKNDLAPTLRGVVYAVAAEQGDAKTHAMLLKLYKKAGLQEERVRILRALTFFKQPAIIRQVLKFSLSDNVRRQDAYMLLGGFGSNRTGRAIAWDFIQTRWKTLTSRYASGGLNLMTRIVEGSTSGFTTQRQLRQTRLFFRKHPVEGAERAMQRSLENIETTIKWAARSEKEITRWLEAYPAKTPAAKAR